MSQNSGGSIPRAAADPSSFDPCARAQAEPQVWVRFEHRLLDLVRRRSNPEIRLRADGDDIVQGLFQGFMATAQDGNRALPTGRDELLRLLVWMAMCRIAQPAHTPNALRRDVRREESPVESPELSVSKLADWMEELHDQESLSPQVAAVAREEFDRLLGKLTEPLQQIFVWKLQGHTNAEISRRITRTERTVELKIQIIRKTLEQDLKARAGSGDG